MNELTQNQLTETIGGNVLQILAGIAIYLFTASKLEGSDDNEYGSGVEAGGTDLPQIDTAGVC